MLQNMSTADNDISVCANCGKGEGESVNLKACTACKFVKYCNRECQIAHRSQHKRECRRRAAEIHDEKLFKQPQPREDCPICFVRLPTFEMGSKYFACCGKGICCGCIYAPRYDDIGNEVANDKCAFCRVPWPTSTEEILNMERKRMEADDPIAIVRNYYDKGMYGYPQDYGKALELWHRAGELGNAEAYNSIGNAYYHGRGLEVDKKMARHYCELGAMRGNAIARYNLGILEEKNGNTERALKHYMIAVKAGESASLKKIQKLYSNGHATKDDDTKALKLYQAYLEEIRSAQRDKAAADFDDRYY